MSSGKIRSGFRKIHYRLTAIFLLIFMVSSIILFWFSFYFIYRSVRETEEDSAKRRLLNYWALYQSGGMELVMEEIGNESFIYEDRPFFIRIADRNNGTLFLRYPESWSGYAIERLSVQSPDDFKGTFILTHENRKSSLSVHSVHLSDEYLLQIGMSNARSVMLLGLYRRNFLFILASLLVMGAAIGLFFAGSILSPLRNLNAGLREIIATGDFSRRIASRGVKDDLEEVILLFNSMLERIEKLVFRMKENIDTVAHDLRTPMTIFRGYAERALREPGNREAAEEALSEALEQSEKILSMMRVIMDISEAETGTLTLHREELDLSELLESLSEMYGIIAQEKDITISLDAPSCRVSADPVRIRQAVGNVLDNAVKFSPAGSRVEMELVPVEEEKGRGAEIRIRDEGPGIPAAELPHIWERLYRGGDTREVPGNGLGLSLVRAVMMAHGGSAEVETVPGKGSLFILKL